MSENYDSALTNRKREQLFCKEAKDRRTSVITDTDDTRVGVVHGAVDHDGDGGAVAQQFSLISTRRPTRDVSDYWVLSSTWQSPTAL
jgi:hypothetical protein